MRVFPVEGEKLCIPFGASNWRLDYVNNEQPKFLSSLIDFNNHTLVLRRVAYDSTFPHLATTNFKLRLD